MSSQFSPFPGPVPPETNPPIQPQFYSPRQRFIQTLTLGITTIVTTTQVHQYVVGQTVRLIIPPYSGTRQFNEQQALVISVPSTTQVELAIDSRFFDPFISTTQPTQPQIFSIGDVNSGQISATGRVLSSTTIPGSFINISPSP